MKHFLAVFILLAGSSQSAQTAPSPASQAEKPATPEQNAKPESLKPDVKLHSDVLKLMEVSGARKRLIDSLPSMLEEGKKQMMKRCPQCSPKFGEEWTKRMQSRFKPDDFLDVLVEAYEKSFTDDEILELIQLREKSGDPQPPVPSAKLKEKLELVTPTLMSDIMAGSVRIASKLGAEVGGEIEKEHPEYIPKPEKP